MQRTHIRADFKAGKGEPDQDSFQSADHLWPISARDSSTSKIVNYRLLYGKVMSTVDIGHLEVGFPIVFLWHYAGLEASWTLDASFSHFLPFISARYSSYQTADRRTLILYT